MPRRHTEQAKCADCGAFVGVGGECATCAGGSTGRWGYYFGEVTIRYLYEEEELSMTQMSALLGCSIATVARYVDLYGIERRVYCPERDDTYRARAKAVRGLRLNEKWRESVISRDGECVECGATDHLQADHIRPFTDLLTCAGVFTADSFEEALERAKGFEALWDIDNGRTLCATCHRNTDTWGWYALYWRPTDMSTAVQNNLF